VRDIDEIEHGVTAFARTGNGGVIVTGGGTGARRERIIALTARLRLPAIYPFRTMRSMAASSATDPTRLI
jgi:putative tryptophan/tyrosine transport system substrate-binding protein